MNGCLIILAALHYSPSPCFLCFVSEHEMESYSVSCKRILSYINDSKNHRFYNYKVVTNSHASKMSSQFNF